ncbi:MAG: hypothetical protein ACN4GR_02220 [Arenicellales bacterium]
MDSLPGDFYPTKNYPDHVLQWMQKNQGDGRPFFAYTVPHDPLHAPKEYIDYYKGKYDGGWDEHRSRTARQGVVVLVLSRTESWKVP